MGDKEIKLERVIPQDYSMLRIRTTGNEILEIGIIKVRNDYSVSKYIGLIKPEDETIRETLHYKDISYNELVNVESIYTVIPRILNMLENDTIICLSSKEQLELLQSKCESIGQTIKNDIIYGATILPQIPKDFSSYLCNSLEILTLF